MDFPESPNRRYRRVPPSWDGNAPPGLSEQPPPLPQPTPPRKAARPSPYLLAHWRGELPLAQSYWVNGVLVGFGMRLLQGALLAWLQAAHLSLTGLLVVICSFAVLRLAISVWQVVGTLRSAALSGSRWAVVVNILMVLGILAIVGSLPGEIAALRQLADGAAEQRKFSQYTIVADARQQAIVAKGTIGIGYADRVKDAFAAHPSFHRLVLDSIGGDVDNGMQLHDFLAARPDITVEVDHLCASACTLAFIGARQRIVSAQGALGFHQMRSMIDNRESRAWVSDTQAKFKALMAGVGASPDFIRLAFAKQGEEVYTPDADELFANHIITGLRLDDRVLDAAQWKREQFLYAFRLEKHSRRIGDALALVRQQWPSIYEAWVDRNLRIAAEAPGHRRDGEYGVSLWLALHAARDRAMHTATAERVRQFATDRRNLLAMLRDRLSPDECGRYLSGHDFHSGAQGDALAEANGESYAALLTGNDPARSILVDWSVAARELAAARARVAHAVPPAAGDAWEPQLCHQQIALLDALLALPPAGSDMALRSFFSQGN